MQHHLYGNHPQNLLVANQFNPESFQVVQQVYYSLEHLRTIYKYLPNIELLGSSIHRVSAIEPYLRDIEHISMDLTKLLNLEYNLEFLRDIQPRVEQLVQELEGIKHKLNTFDDNFKEVLGLMETNTKNLEDLYCQYESGLQDLMEQFKDELCSIHSSQLEEMNQLHKESKEIAKQVKLSMPTVQKAVDTHNEFNLLLQHLKASDLVTLAQFTGSEEDYSKALKAIKASEKWGNDESLNRLRLNYKLPNNSVFGTLKANEERLTKEKE